LFPSPDGQTARCAITMMQAEAAPSFIFPHGAKCERPASSTTSSASPFSTTTIVREDTTSNAMVETTVDASVAGTITAKGRLEMVIAVQSNLSDASRRLSQDFLGVSVFNLCPDVHQALTIVTAVASDMLVANCSWAANSTLLADFVITIPPSWRPAGVTLTADSLVSILEGVADESSPFFPQFRKAAELSIFSRLGVRVIVTPTGVTVLVFVMASSIAHSLKEEAWSVPGTMTFVAGGVGLLAVVTLVITLVWLVRKCWFKNGRHQG